MSSGEDSDSVEAMTAAFWKLLLNKKQTSKAVNPSAPPYASLFLVAADKAEVKEKKVNGFESTGKSIFCEMLINDSRPLMSLIIEGKQFEGLVDTRANVSVISLQQWPND